MKIFDKNNFYKNTFCIFKEVSTAEISELQWHFVSKSGSCYYFTTEGVYRKSSHWGRAAKCKWRLQTLEPSTFPNKIGFAAWSNFHPIDEIGKWYYIEVDWNNKTAQYYHKNCSTTASVFLRNAAQTTKRIKEIRHLMANPTKLTYWDTEESLSTVLQKAVEKLITTDLTLLQIKQQLLSSDV